MANDREVLREVWEGKIPVCFQLDSEEVSDIQPPEPFYLMVPRMSYLPLVTEKVGINIFILIKYNLLFLFKGEKIFHEICKL